MTINNEKSAEKVKSRFTVHANEGDNAVVFILEGETSARSHKWLAVGFRREASLNERRAYAQAICDLLNR